MSNKFIALIIVIIIIIFGISAFLLSQQTDVENNNNKNINDNNSSNTFNNTTNNSNTSTGNTNHKGNIDQNGVTASLNGPISSSEGKTVQLTWKIINSGNESISSVSAIDQLNSHEFGTMAPGESKSFTVSLRIFTLKSLRQDFGPDVIISNPHYIGGYSVTYDLNGIQFQFNANALKIKLV